MLRGKGGPSESSKRRSILNFDGLPNISIYIISFSKSVHNFRNMRIFLFSFWFDTSKNINQLVKDHACEIRSLILHVFNRFPFSYEFIFRIKLLSKIWIHYEFHIIAYDWISESTSLLVVTNLSSDDEEFPFTALLLNKTWLMHHSWNRQRHHWILKTHE